MGRKTKVANHLFKEDSVYLFPSEKTGQRLGERGLRYLVQKNMRLANLDGFSARDLRHRFGYVMAERTPLHRLAQIMGLVIIYGANIIYFNKFLFYY